MSKTFVPSAGDYVKVHRMIPDIFCFRLRGRHLPELCLLLGEEPVYGVDLVDKVVTCLSQTRESTFQRVLEPTLSYVATKR